MRANERDFEVIALATAWTDEKNTDTNNYVLRLTKDRYLFFCRPFDWKKATLDDCVFLQLFCENKGFTVEFETL